MNKASPPRVAVIGGGPAGLMAAETLLSGGVRVDIYDAMPSVGRKFLIAGKGGLNLTHDEPHTDFISRFGERSNVLKPMLDDFDPDKLRAWAKELGFETFVGSSGKVFPVGMAAAPLLRAWQNRLREQGAQFHFRHRWLGWSEENALRFEVPNGEFLVGADAVVLALGGGSWPQTGSTGAWIPLLQARGVDIAPLKPANCGFDVKWTEYFRTRFEGEALKSVALSFDGKSQRGELVITKTGVEGSLIYAFSAKLRDALSVHGEAIPQLDLTPDWTETRLQEVLSKPRGSRSVSNHLKKQIGLTGVKANFLWEFVPREHWSDPSRMSAAIKALPLPLVAPRPLEEAISSAGGVTFESLDENMMLHALPGVFCAGEMLDWEAPTGGYLLTACFATGRTAGTGILGWLLK